jgi:hypothetical protein
MKRAMEKENKKERDKAKRAFNDNVKHLVDYIKKRDRRVSEHMKEVVRRKQEEAERAAERKREQEREKQERMKRLQAELAAQEEENGVGDEDDALLEGTLREFEGGEDEDESNRHIFCAYCNKVRGSACVVYVCVCVISNHHATGPSLIELTPPHRTSSPIRRGRTTRSPRSIFRACRPSPIN